eukprot:Amastigsp_a428_37.p2 type:complete len:244 gc:universal Amastigsp_a428_37:1169-438(-)
MESARAKPKTYRASTCGSMEGAALMDVALELSQLCTSKCAKQASECRSSGPATAAGSAEAVAAAAAAPARAGSSNQDTAQSSGPESQGADDESAPKRRLLQNRIAAKKSRERKKAFVSSLEEQLIETKAELETLRAQLASENVSGSESVPMLRTMPVSACECVALRAERERLLRAAARAAAVESSLEQSLARTRDDLERTTAERDAFLTAIRHGDGAAGANDVVRALCETITMQADQLARYKE